MIKNRYKGRCSLNPKNLNLPDVGKRNFMELKGIALG
jgi:hypothetical protein